MSCTSFLTLRIFWVGQQTQINHLPRFSTALLAEFTEHRLALPAYGLHNSSAREHTLLSWVCTSATGLVRITFCPKFQWPSNTAS
jgi:hypothetical protein